MTEMIHVDQGKGLRQNLDLKANFRKDIEIGFSQTHKIIPSKYFYDEQGSLLFNQISRHPDYYLTQCETRILQANKRRLATLMGNEAFNLIELGPGEGVKTKLLLNEFDSDRLEFNYLPIDISEKYLNEMMKVFEKEMPAIKLQPIHADYFRGLEWLNDHSDRQNLVLFLGSSIGNFTLESIYDFLQHLWGALKDGDYVLIGFDLRKDVDLLMRAYNDADGITRQFNLNLLNRINRELRGEFDLQNFQHFATYNVYSGAMESYLISMKTQSVAIRDLNQTYHFDKIEPIHVEYSHKYLLSEIHHLAKQTGFVVVEDFKDEKDYFVDTLWQVKKI